MHYNICVMPGDGIGPEVARQAVSCLKSVLDVTGHSVNFTNADIGGAAVDACNNPLPEISLKSAQNSDAVILGAVGGPKWDGVAAEKRPEVGLLKLRRELNLYANLRPIKSSVTSARISPLRAELSNAIDMMFVRELTGGIYFGEKHQRDVPRQGESDSIREAVDICTYNETEIWRIIQVAGILAQRRSNSITSVDKANVLETSRLWRDVATRCISSLHSGISITHQLVDSCAMLLLLDPKRFDVIVTENMFGDILTDQASALVGSIGLIPSASFGPDSEQLRIAREGGTQASRWFGLYEPIHGSAPDIAGKGIANPVGAILSAALLLRYSLCLEDEAALIERAVDRVLNDGFGTPDLKSERVITTEEMGERISAEILSGKTNCLTLS